MGAFTLGMLAGVQLHQRLSSADRGYPIWQGWMKAWTRGLLALFGVEHVLAGPVPPPAAGARLVVSNHRSPLDIAIMLTYFGGCVLSRHDLADWPILGLAARKSETIFVDRDDAYSGLSAIRQIRQRLKLGRTVTVFPEGTTFGGDEVRPFHGGAFVATRGLSVELLPVGVAYDPGAEFVDETFMQHIDRVASRPTTRVAVSFGNARPARGKHASMSAEMRREVRAQVGIARRALGGR
jgi:1-acyl-sn-glycerol-3-phosphate acyltransferase